MTTESLTPDTQAVGVHTFNVDLSHSQVSFSVRHLGFSKVRGRFSAFEATVQLDPSDLSTLTTEATIEAASVTTGQEQRDTHLRSADFFDADTFPTLSFKSTGVEAVSGDTLKLSGDLTIHGVTRSVVLAVEYLGTAIDPWGGHRVAFEAKTTINRKDFGLMWNSVLESGGLLVGEEVEISLEIQAVQQG